MAKKNKPTKKPATKKPTKKPARRSVAAELGDTMKAGIAVLKKRHSRHTGAGAVDHSRAPIVRGPQLALDRVVVPPAHVPAKGNPLVAFRHDENTVNLFVKKHGGRDQAWKAIRAWMSAQVGR
jgi:hypothetical protein